MKVPTNPEELRTLLTRHQFKIVEEEIMEKEIVFDDIPSLNHFVFHTGWCASPLLLQFSQEEIQSYAEMLTTYLPIRDVVKVVVVLAKKRSMGSSISESSTSTHFAG